MWDSDILYSGFQAGFLGWASGLKQPEDNEASAI